MLVTSFVSMEINTQLLLTLKEGSKKKKNNKKTKRKINVKQTKRQRKKALAQLSVSQQKGGDIPLAKGLVWVWFHTS